jgi:hypothetical protein
MQAVQVQVQVQVAGREKVEQYCGIIKGLWAGFGS